MTVKGAREGGAIQALATTNTLMLLPKVGKETNSSKRLNDRVFTCKTCSKQFPSFQALGGHRASHNKLPRLMGEDSINLHLSELSSKSSPAKPKTHECPICGLEFPMSQALGGHMRRHGTTTTDVESGGFLVAPKAVTPVLNRSNSKRVWGLDLKLWPLEKDDLRLQLGKMEASYGEIKMNSF